MHQLSHNGLPLPGLLHNRNRSVIFRRKKKAVHKTTSTDDKRLQNTLKRLGVNTIPGIEEVNIFQDETVIHFTNPKGARATICAGAAVVGRLAARTRNGGRARDAALVSMQEEMRKPALARGM